jgi:transcriptional regulator of arginine metabolism
VLGAQRILRDDGIFAYHLRAGAPGPFPADMILSVEHNEAMVVIRTRVGRAQAVGFDLDAMKHSDVMGTLAGDDTVLVIPRSMSATTRLATELRQLAGL